jgi:hypothetical protein
MDFLERYKPHPLKHSSQLESLDSDTCRYKTAVLARANLLSIKRQYDSTVLAQLVVQRQILGTCFAHLLKNIGSGRGT